LSSGIPHSFLKDRNFRGAEDNVEDKDEERRAGVGESKLEIGDSKLEIGDWRLEMGDRVGEGWGFPRGFHEDSGASRAEPLGFSWPSIKPLATSVLPSTLYVPFLGGDFESQSPGDRVGLVPLFFVWGK
jgi:hypothetical protein